MAAKMKAGVLFAPGDIRCENVDVPAIGPGEVLVRVRAAGVCGSDVPRVMVTGAYRHPLVPGHEFAGEVAKVGSDVKSVSVGDRVCVIPCIPCGTCIYCRAGEYFHCLDYDYLGSRRDGGFAEFVRVPEGSVIKLPDDVDFELGAAVEPATVALHAITRGGGIQPGGSVAVFGAGPIGALVMQWAKALGAGLVVGVDIQEKRLEMIKGLGADSLIDASAVDPKDEIAKLTGGMGVDLAFESAGSSSALLSAILAVRRKGGIVLIGRPGNPVNLGPPEFTQILRKELDTHGVWGFEFTSFPRHAWNVALEFMSRGKIKIAPLITHRLSLDRIGDTFRMMHLRKEFFNKVMFIMP